MLSKLFMDPGFTGAFGASLGSLLVLAMVALTNRLRNKIHAPAQKLEETVKAQTAELARIVATEKKVETLEAGYEDVRVILRLLIENNAAQSGVLSVSGYRFKRCDDCPVHDSDEDDRLARAQTQLDESQAKIEKYLHSLV